MPRFAEVGIVLGLLALMVVVGVIPIRWSKWVPDLSAGLKTAVLLLLGFSGISYALTHGVANSFAPAAWVPSMDQNLTFLPVVVFSLMGFELMSSAGAAIEEPKRDVPKMIGFAGTIIIGVYLLATFGILGVIPVDEINIVTGISDAFAVVFTNVFGADNWIFPVTVAALVFSLFGTMATWSLGANHEIAAASADHAVPRVFGWETPWETPWVAALLMGLIAAGTTLLNYGFFASNESVFWTIFALSSVVFLLPYLMMFPALLVLRKKEPERPRPYTVPGGRFGAISAVVLCETFVGIALVLFFYAVPEGTPTSLYWGVTAGGAAICVAIGLWFAQMCRRPTR